jgi:hypothetical protein
MRRYEAERGYQETLSITNHTSANERHIYLSRQDRLKSDLPSYYVVFKGRFPNPPFEIEGNFFYTMI